MFKQAALPYLWMLAGSLAFACMSTLAYGLKEHCDWLVVATARTGLALAFAAVLAKAAGAKLVLWRPGTLWVRSIAGSVSLICTFYALSRIYPGDVQTLTNIFPLWVALISWPLLSESPTPQVWVALVAGLAGVALVQLPHFEAGEFAVIAALGSSVSTAVALLGLHRLQGIDPRAIVVHFSAVGLAACLLLSPRFAGATPLRGLDEPATLAMLLGVGVSATIGQVFLTKAFAAGPPAKVSVVSLTQVAFSAALDRMLWGRSFEPQTLLGMALVLAPTAWLMIQREPEPASLARLGE